MNARYFLSFATLGVASVVVALINFGIGTLHTENLASTTPIFGSARPKSALMKDQLFATKYQEPRPRPRLEDIVTDWNITGDASWLLNFAIVGFPKCGTSTLMFHLQKHPEVQIFSDERCDIGFNQQVKLIRDIYADFPPGNFARGIKCPMDLESTKLGMRNYDRYFPKTDFIVGIRHPVLWFESFYNFRIHNEFPMKPADQLIGKCRKGNFNVCTFRSNFHIFLSNLRKTNMTDNVDEQRYVAAPFRRSLDPLPHNKRRVFLYEVSQLSDDSSGREGQFRVDLQSFLGLRQPIEPLIWFKPGRQHSDEKVIQRTNSKKINICDEKYEGLRNVLMEQAVNASRWIREFFVNSPDVTVSSPEYFVKTLMPSWEQDPCLNRKI